MKPWYRRTWGWIIDAHTLVAKIITICVTTIAVHAFLRGIPFTRADLRTEVRAALEEAIEEGKISKADTQARIRNLELRADLFARSSEVETLTGRMTAVEKVADRAYQLADSASIRARR